MRMLLILFLAGTAWVAAAQAPATPGVYQFSPEFPKYVTAHIEVRDPSGQRWPSFFYGKPAGSGAITITGAKPNAAFTLKCDKRPQKNGDQSQRVLGELGDSADKAGVLLQINAIGPVTPQTGGKKEEFQTTFTGSLDIAGRKLTVNAPGTLRVHQGGRSDEKNDAVMGDLQFDIKASELGLKTFAPDAPIRIRAAFTAYAPGAGVRRPPIR